jgi:osmotically-inducible protein OsmY
MADRNRNRQEWNQSSGDWNEDQNRQRRSYEDEPNYTSSENRGYSGRSSGMQSGGDGGWESRYERQGNSGRQGDFSNDYNSGRFGRQSDSDSNYGSFSNRGATSGYADFGGDYSSRSGSRNLYDRDYEGMNRSSYENRSGRIGGANYGSYGDRGRFGQGGGYSGSQQYGGSQEYGGSQYGRNYGSDRDRNYGRGDSGERSWWDRTTDEVSSWFGDEDAERRRDRDRSQGGQYKGKGPRNYSRSDERIKEDINDRLSDDPFVDASEIDVTVSNGEVTLTGSVDHRSTKRRAEDLAEAVSGVKNVENRLRVSQTVGTQTLGSQNTGVSGMGSPSGSSASSQSSSAVPGSERSRKESSYANGK